MTPKQYMAEMSRKSAWPATPSKIFSLSSPRSTQSMSPTRAHCTSTVSRKKVPVPSMLDPIATMNANDSAFKPNWKRYTLFLK